MNGRDGSVCCLSLLDEKDLEGIVGVGVLLLSDLGDTVSAGSSLVLGKSGRVLREPTMPLRASVVFVSSCTRQGNDIPKAVPVKFRWLRPWRVRVLGLECGQNLLSRVGQFLNRKLDNSDATGGKWRISQSFEVWCVDECWQEPESQSVASCDCFDNASETCCVLGSRKVSFGFSKICKCGFCKVIGDIDKLHIRELWGIASFLASKINQDEAEKIIKHFGFLAPISEVGWVKEAHYQNLPKSYRKSKRQKATENIYKLKGELLEEMVKEKPIRNILYHPVSQFIWKVVIICFFIIELVINVGSIDSNTSGENINLITFFFLYFLFMVFVKVWRLPPFDEKSKLRRNAKARKLSEWKDIFRKG